ncbi:zinc-binding alcohol dehydrogenase family protein [Schlesneria sp. T3-172]|uniref:quinone oxidoreductase family protein n=1 Tax=Schlesneria sphaerica TaxID=3373610 RepID=UPI0037CBA556
MKGLVTSSPGGWQNTRLEQVDLRVGRPEEVLVEIRAVGLNPADNFQIEGKYPGGPQPPFLPGRDACGVVIQGDSTGRWQPGDEVVALQTSTSNLRDGTLCEQQWLAAENLARKPRGWSDVEAAAAPLAYQTAWKALFDVGALEAGQTVVVTGASGGVGLACVQLASALGARVVALSRSEEKRQKLQRLGASHVFAPDHPQLKDQIFSAIGAKGVSLVVENVGGPSLATSIHLLGVHGRVSVVGLLAGVESVVPLPSLMFKRASIHGVLVTDDSPPKAQSSWKALVELMNSKQIRPIVCATYPLDSVEKAFKHLGGDVFGKVVVEIPSAM